MNHILTLFPIASADGFRDGVWIGLMSAIAILLVVKLFRQNAAMAPASAPSGSSPASSPFSSRIIVNIPPDLKAIAALPGDTSIEGQRALLWYNVYKEAISALSGGGDTYLSLGDNASAVAAANDAVRMCYGEFQS